MPKLQVIARVPLPDIRPMGATVTVDVTRRIEGLVANGYLDVVGPGPRPSVDELPDGTIAEVMRWVGDDPVRAAAALDRERSSTAPRTTLIARLSSVVDPLGPADPDDDYAAAGDNSDSGLPVSLVGA